MTARVGLAITWLIPLLGALLIFHRVVGHSRGDGYTRCGNCDHILKGLSEPRCPECGQKI
jgi:hypothetical protein